MQSQYIILDYIVNKMINAMLADQPRSKLASLLSMTLALVASKIVSTGLRLLRFLIAVQVSIRNIYMALTVEPQLMTSLTKATVSVRTSISSRQGAVICFV